MIIRPIAKTDIEDDKTDGEQSMRLNKRCNDDIAERRRKIVDTAVVRNG